MTIGTLPKPYAHVIATEFDGGEGVLIDVNSKRYYQLNETAMLVWRSLEQGRALPEVAGTLSESYEVSSERASACITRLLGDLQARGLIG